MQCKSPVEGTLGPQCVSNSWDLTTPVVLGLMVIPCSLPVLLQAQGEPLLCSRRSSHPLWEGEFRTELPSCLREVSCSGALEKQGSSSGARPHCLWVGQGRGVPAQPAREEQFHLLPAGNTTVPPGCLMTGLNFLSK